jgi:hypothetical protein
VALRTNKFLLLAGGWESARAPVVATASSCLLMMNRCDAWAPTSADSRGPDVDPAIVWQGDFKVNKRSLRRGRQTATVAGVSAPPALLGDVPGASKCLNLLASCPDGPIVEIFNTALPSIHDSRSIICSYKLTDSDKSSSVITVMTKGRFR